MRVNKYVVAVLVYMFILIPLTVLMYELPTFYPMLFLLIVAITIATMAWTS